jgi:hypothetical protein
MKRFFSRGNLLQGLWWGFCIALFANLYWGPGKSNDLYRVSDSTGLAVGFGSLALVLLGLAALLRNLPRLAYRERRLPDGFEWRRPMVRRLMTAATFMFMGYFVAQGSGYALAAWRGQNWLLLAMFSLMAMTFLAVAVVEIRRLFDTSVVLSVTADGLTAGDRALGWSQIEAAVFDRYRWHEFGVVLAGDDGRGSREWWFSLADAGIEAPYFLDRLERAAPQVEVLKPKGEPMAGAHPIPAA